MAGQREAAAALFDEGVRPAEVARRLSVSRATATRWHALWRAGGAAFLTARPPRGRPPKLAASELAAVREALARSPRDSGLAQDTWTLDAAVLLVQRLTGVAYHPRHVVRVLARAGWVVPPLGPSARQAFRRVAQLDPDGNEFFLRAGPHPRG